ncbi:hypothetical protein [Microbacterium sp. Root553]|uniref:hypothetical protein n=1 Tax=Microbacterium sp. Root553 TaxID=1736556 RepID=UPI0006FFEDE5|nr:hypothetical protein [Microbacterium sp. Root553]KQZ23655.1 hypothetical protein ASD43_04230 [Microbacterium sp. Root553]
MPSRINDPRASALSRIGQRTIAVVATAGTIIAGSLLWSGQPAHATEDSAGVTVQEVAVALDGVSSELMQTAVEPTESSASAPLQVQVPATASEGVSLSVEDFDLNISLPNAAASAGGQLLGDGTTVYPADGASSNAVIPTAGGVQLLSILESREASESYSYDLTIPAAHRLEATADGGARIVDEQGTVKVEFEAAWAEDASGAAVPTHYVVEGNTLTQVVEHKGLADVAYPIVADPLPVVVFVVTGLALVAVAALALGVASWLVISWWNTCQAKGKYPELSTKNGFTARCVR